MFVVLVSGSCTRDPAIEQGDAAAKAPSTTQEPDDAPLFVLGRWSAPDEHPAMAYVSAVDSDRDGCPEVSISTRSGASHVVHGRCARGSVWSSMQLEESIKWAGLVALGDRGHALVEQRGAEIHVSCGALSEGRWRRDAGSTVVLENGLFRPLLLTSPPDRESFALLDEFVLIEFEVDDACQLRERRRVHVPWMALTRLDWWVGKDGAAQLCLTGAGEIALTAIQCASWPPAGELELGALTMGTFVSRDLVGVLELEADRVGFSLARPALESGALAFHEAGMRVDGTFTDIAGVVRDDASVVVLGGVQGGESMLAMELRLDGTARPLPQPQVEGALQGLASLEVDGRPGFAVVSTGDKTVHLTVLGVR